ncbi:hypothetical protein [Amycolatopsis sp. CA-128772]|uniref:hypothetical protein n=1 Tax=Amycolatopsis sp. CA-128772 TaxID=2073159 RepID=UPI001E4B0B15|nr:hypothetical protein [Amycolatopsis sp. CA-128772]
MRRTLSVFAVLLAGSAGLTGLAPPAAVAAGTSATATLITGDRITVRTAPDGRDTFEIQPAAAKGMARALVHLRLGGRDYEVPGTALPYLGRGLDLNLFDVEALLAGAANPADAATFGAALAKQFNEDNARGHFGGQGLFANGARYALAGAPQREAVQPRSVMRTVSVDATDIAGEPADTGIAFLYNTDDGNTLAADENFNYFAGGTAKFSVPDGHYSALGVFWTADADGNPTELRFSAQPEFAVKADATVRVDAKRASAKLTWVTPRPALLDDTGFLFRRAAKTGPALVVDFDAGPGVPISVSPSAVPVRTGALQTYPYSRLVSPPGPGTPYEYVLQKASIGTIPQQRYVITAKDVASVDATYYSEYRSAGLRQRSGMFTFEDGGGRPSHPIDLPRKQTEYVSAAPDLVWFGGVSKYVLPGPFPGWAGGQYEAFHGYQGGSTVTEGWNRFPLHPAGAVALRTDPTVYTLPAATRAGDLLRFSITPFSDNEPGHTGFGYYGESRDTVTGHYRLTQDGTTLAEGTPSGGFEVAFEREAGAAPSTLGLTVDAGRTGPMYHQSTASHTEWTWQSQHVEGATLPPALYCARGENGPDRACAVEPLLTLQYAVGGLRPDGSTLSGPQSLDLTVGHLQQSAASPVTGATVQYSTDGTTWLDAAVTARGNGVFHADFPATTEAFRGTDVSLRVTASDAAGATIAESVAAAYHVYLS